VKVSVPESLRRPPKRQRACAINGTNLRRFVAACLFLFLIASSSQADEWVTPKNPERGYKLLGRVVLNVEIRADGTVKRAWPAASGIRAPAAWRAAKAAKRLTFRRGAERTIQMPVTVYLK
jgi:hypothetical protein